jgi:hypothetical protein
MHGSFFDESESGINSKIRKGNNAQESSEIRKYFPQLCAGAAN